MYMHFLVSLVLPALATSLVAAIQLFKENQRISRMSTNNSKPQKNSLGHDSTLRLVRVTLYKL